MTEQEKYNPQAIEPKWQQRWEQDQLYRSQVDWSKPKHYALTMLPYPSGDLHIGHWFAMTPSDARARYMRMKGFNVLFPMGFDAFGLPAENAAVQRGIHPATWTHANIERMRKQLRSMGAMFDWEREAVSCEPEYYRWTEWFFKQFYQGDLAYRGEALVNWSPTLQTVLANEQVIDGKDERTGQPVIQKMLTQWFFRMTKYADELLTYPDLDYPDPIKTMQTNWIGRSEGARVIFHTEQGHHPIEIFTTRPDTLWGATFMVLSPEHELVAKITSQDQREAVTDYVAEAARQTEIDRLSDEREKTGVFTGAYAINPVNQERIPIWIADYVLISYGTGAIMAVPAHDERDFAFARKYGLPIRVVIQPEGDSLNRQHHDRSLSRRGRDGQQRRVRRHARHHRQRPPESGHQRGDRLHRAKRHRPGVDQLPDARLADQPPALLGIAHPGHLPAGWQYGNGAGWSTAGEAARRRENDRRRQSAGAARRLRQRDRQPRPTRSARNRHDGHFHVLVVVLVSLPESALHRRPVRSRRGGLLAAGRYLHRRHGTRHHASAVRPLVRQSHA